MELTVKFSEHNDYPLRGFFIKETSPYSWVKEIQKLGLKLNEVEVYGLPNNEPNTVWGCIVITKTLLTETQKGKHELSQSVYTNFFIPEKSVVIPKVLELDRQLLFSDKMTVYHPEIGFVICEDKILFKDHIKLPQKKMNSVFSPEESTFIPNQVKSFQVKPLEDEDVLERLEEAFPKTEKLKDEPLNFVEKAKLMFYKTIFSGSGKRMNESGDADGTTSGSESKGWFLDKIQKLFKKPIEENKFFKKIEQDFEELEKRNQSQLDKLMDLFEDNPEEALKYAIPFDEENSVSRGGNNNGSFELAKRNNFFSLFNSSSQNSSSGGNVVFEEDSMDRLRSQYNQTAKDLIAKGEYKKAAFVYLKLLKNYHLAGSTLLDGGYYQEAAAVYLKHTSDKRKAAECYEKGRMNMEAIEIYKELNNYEKVGDLYSDLNKRDKAVPFYEKTIEELLSKNNYISASDIYKNKIGDFNQSQFTLLDGWKNDSRERQKCLAKYLGNIPDLKRLKAEIDLIKEKTVRSKNATDFLNIIQDEYQKKNEIALHLKKVGYEIIAEQSSITPSIVNQLKGFNTEDKEILKDIQRFKVFRKGNS